MPLSATMAVRADRGNMLLLCLGVFAVIILVVAIAYGVNFLFMSQSTLVSRCESLTLRAAQELNAGDCAGRLNNLQSRSRELVYTSRQMQQMTEEEDFSDLAPLANQVMAQARDGALLVAAERQKFAGQSIANLRKLVREEVSAEESIKQLANMSTSDPKIVDMQVGYLGNATSNCEPNSAFPYLYEEDMQKGYIQRGKQLNLYRANLNLKLPGPDADLEFVLAPLPPPVKGTIAPLRLASGSHFTGTFVLRKDGADSLGTCKLSPSAVRVTMTEKVRENILTDMQSTTRAETTACANGATPEPN